MTPKVMATPLISGGNVSVTIASFTGGVVYASQCARSSCQWRVEQVTTSANRCLSGPSAAQREARRAVPRAARPEARAQRWERRRRLTYLGLRLWPHRGG